MPLYEYECQACGHRFEQIRKFSDPPLAVCPKCGGPIEKLVSSPAFHLKGSGWYATDYGKRAESTEKGPEGAEKSKSTETTEKAGSAEKSDKGTESADKSAEKADKTGTAEKRTNAEEKKDVKKSEKKEAAKP